MMLEVCLWSEAGGQRSELLSGRGCDLVLPPDVVTQGDIHEDAAAAGFEADDQRLGVLAAGGAVFGSEENWRMDAEMEALIVQGGDRISGDLVGQLTNRFPYQFVGFGQIGAREVAGYPHRSLRVEVEDNSALDVPAERHQRGHAFAAVNLLLHAEVPNRHGRLQALRQYGVSRVDEGLDQLHLHDQAPAPAALATAPSSPSTYLTTSYRTSGLTGFCTK